MIEEKVRTAGVETSPLGEKTKYIEQYDSSLLYPIARKQSRDSLGIDNNRLPFHGEDVWHAFELSWLNDKGKPQVALARFTIPCTSTNIIESKSFKLYLNSFNQTKVANKALLLETLMQDISHAVGGQAKVELIDVGDPLEPLLIPKDLICLDNLDVTISGYKVDSSILKTSPGYNEEVLYTNLFKANCKVTGQPDWATLFVHYAGKRIDKISLLQYLISYRQHNDFHEHCVEGIFKDLLQFCECEKLSVYACFTRRGGLDINPFRANFETKRPEGRLVRQ